MNVSLKRERHITSTIDDIIMQLNNAKVFSKLGLNKSFHQLELAEHSSNLATFSTYIGLRRYKIMSYGIL